MIGVVTIVIIRSVVNMHPWYDTLQVSKLFKKSTVKVEIHSITKGIPLITTPEIKMINRERFCG